MSPAFSGALSRRDFLKLAGCGLAGLFLPPLPRLEAPPDLLTDQQGRVVEKLISVYDVPSTDGTLVKQYWRDLVLPITALTISDDEEAYNRVWYRIGELGYAYSGGIQPVRTVLNEPVMQIPESGLLAEVSVPYTDARWEANEEAKFAYRLYYETTYWVDAAIVNEDEQKVWYRIWDDKLKEIYYVPAQHLRIIPDEELTPISPDVPDYRKSIEVRLLQQLVVAYEGRTPVFATRAATGARFRSGTFSTPVGHYQTFYKRPSRHMAAGDIASNGYDLPGVPWVCYITDGGISFHGTYWHNDYGRPRSHGCVNLTPQAAKWLFRWTSPAVPTHKPFAYEHYGTYVEVVER
jgi:lipoprotein-anchoring transpeptidase ErfK/SrfK